MSLPFLADAQSGTLPSEPTTFPIPVGRGGAGLSQADKTTIDSFRLIRASIVLAEAGFGLLSDAERQMILSAYNRPVPNLDSFRRKTDLIKAEEIPGKVAISQQSLSRTPTGAVNYHLMYTADTITVLDVREVLQGTTPSVTYRIEYGVNRGVADGTIVASHAATSTSGAAATLTASTTILPGRFIWVVITAISGTLTDFGVTITYN
ncbi:hypothetical protein BUE76_11920 [Cnuella takakiae]|nr:hypothetical protein BUE76_11920 [Cnuella takakiae]